MLSLLHQTELYHIVHYSIELYQIKLFKVDP
jgi:hypothetical protein